MSAERNFAALLSGLGVVGSLFFTLMGFEPRPFLPYGVWLVFTGWSYGALIFGVFALVVTWND